MRAALTVGLVAVAMSGCAAHTDAARFTVHGSYTIYSRAGDEFAVGRGRCAGAGLAQAVAPGAPVVVTDDNDHVLATAALHAGRVVLPEGNAAAVRTSCAFAFSVRDVPEGLRYYRVLVGGRRVEALSRAEAHRPLSLTFDPAPSDYP